MTRMSDARSQRRFEEKMQKKAEKRRPVSVAFSVGFQQFEDGHHRVGLFYGEGEPTDDTLVSSMPIRGDLTRERKEDIVCKFMTLAAACITSPDERATVFHPSQMRRVLSADAGDTDAAPAKPNKVVETDLWADLLGKRSEDEDDGKDE
jgi:hypothetical protein